MLAQYLDWDLCVMLLVSQELLQIIVVDFEILIVILDFSDIN